MKIIFTTLFILIGFTVFGQKFTPKLIEDSTKTRYHCFTIEQSRNLAEKIKAGEICEEKSEAMEKQIELLKERNEVCDSLVDSLKVNYKRANIAIENQKTIIKNKDKELNIKQEIQDNQQKVINKQEKKIVRRNNVIKILSIIDVAVLVILIIL